MNEITLSELADDYIKNIEKLLEFLKGRIAVFDFDGTLTEFKYAENRLLPCRDDYLYEYSKHTSIYDNARILKTMRYVVSKLEPQEVYVLTTTVMALRPAKTAKILEYFPILPEHIIHTDSAVEKTGHLQQLHDTTGREIAYIDDTAKVILNAEEVMDFVHGFHTSSLLA